MRGFCFLFIVCIFYTSDAYAELPANLNKFRKPSTSAFVALMRAATKIKFVSGPHSLHSCGVAGVAKRVRLRQVVSGMLNPNG